MLGCIKRTKYLLNGGWITIDGVHRQCATDVASLESLAKAYQPRVVESHNWQRVMSPCAEKTQGTFRMLLPPPNVTGNLHLGHALTAVVQDVICRQRSQLGYDVQWIPGTDHASIATQVVVEKKLLAEGKTSRHQLGRETFLQEVWKWKTEKAEQIETDLKKLGCMLNWDEKYFTMDERHNETVKRAFIRLFNEKLITRERVPVNWSCSLESSISDIEVEVKELYGATKMPVPGHRRLVTFGRCYDIAYRICGTNDEIVVTTTRPETLLGDMAVAVHPEDARYSAYRNMKHLKLWHPFRHEAIPLIFDLSVQRDEGTGALKVTPAHDRLDFEIGRRHYLKPMTVFNTDGRISANFPEFQGMPRFEARELMMDRLSAMQLVRDVRDCNMLLPICSRTKDVVEALLREQWLLDCTNMATAAASEVHSGRLIIEPSNFVTEWHRWLQDIRPWCISRQLWWGQRVPAYFARDAMDKTCWVAAINEEEALCKARQKLDMHDVTIEQDADVLDTWFSSALLPLSTSNWPANDFRCRYPLDMLDTGHDILCFWAARMVMLGLQLTGELPFKRLLLHGIICDPQGRKMSKSIGNVVSPDQIVQGTKLDAMLAEVRRSHTMGIIEDDELYRSVESLQKIYAQGIPECGTDALRFTLCSHNIKTHFINFDVSECYANKLFLNKVWQATRFTLAATEKYDISPSELPSLDDITLSRWDQWILGRLHSTLLTCARSRDDFSFHSATAALQHFFYDSLCDIYLETTKPDIKETTAAGRGHCVVLAICLSNGLYAMWPFTPFIAEELLQYLAPAMTVDLTRYISTTVEAEVVEVLRICEAIRQLKSRNNITRRHEPRLHLLAHTPDALDRLRPHLREIQALTMSSAVDLQPASVHECGTKFDFYTTAGHMCSFGLTISGHYVEADINGRILSEMNARKLQKLQERLQQCQERMERNSFKRFASVQVREKQMEKIRKLETEIRNMKTLAL